MMWMEFDFMKFFLFFRIYWRFSSLQYSDTIPSFSITVSIHLDYFLTLPPSTIFFLANPSTNNSQIILLNSLRFDLYPKPILDAIDPAKSLPIFLCFRLSQHGIDLLSKQMLFIIHDDFVDRMMIFEQFLMVAATLIGRSALDCSRHLKKNLLALSKAAALQLPHVVL